MLEAKTFARGAVSAEPRGLWQYNSPKENCRRDCKLRAPHPVTSNQHRRCSSRARPREYTKTKPRGRSRCTSTREAPRNKSRGRLDRTLVLGCCGAAAQNAGSRPGLPLIAPDTRRFQPTPHGRKARPPPSKIKTSTNHPRDEEKLTTSRRGLDAQRWARETNTNANVY